MQAQDWISIVAQIITVTGLLGVWKVLSKKIEAAGNKASTIDDRFFKMITAQMHNLASQRPPEKTRGLDINFETGNRYVVLLILGEWIQITTGVKLQGMYERKGATTYQIQVDNIWRLRPHSHAEKEIVRVTQGTMKDLDTDRIYIAGESWEIPAGELHAVEFRASRHGPCMVMVTTIPELKPLSETPLLLDDLEGLICQT